MSESPDHRAHIWPDLDGQPAPGAAEFLPIALHRVMTPPAPVAEDPTIEDSVPPLRLEGHELVHEAREQADSIRRQVREEEAERARAIADQALRESVDEQVAAFTQAAEELMAQARAAFEGRLDGIEEQSVTLVTAMTEKVIGLRLEADDEVVLGVVRSALAEAAGASQVTLRVSPDDDELVQGAQGELIAALGTVDQLRVIADESISRGGCIIETERGRFDARIETQLQLLEQHVERLLKAG